jgi:hypothetical protein
VILMKRPFRSWCAAGGVLALAMISASLLAAGPTFNPLQTFAPFRYPDPVSQYRMANGLPSPEYWQNRADYDIDATLDPQRKTLSATEIITYTNHSPSELGFVWLQLDQNLYKPDARGNFTSGPTPDGHTSGYQIASVDVAPAGSDAFTPAPHPVSDTRMRVDLPHPLAAANGTIRVRIVYRYEIPGEFGDRTDWFHTKNGDIFEIAQWYPRLCVYDDLRGWNTLPFLNSEFYLEYGSFDYRITLPSTMIVVGSGELVNPDEVLTATERQRLDEARRSDTTVLIRTPQDVTNPASRPRQSPTLTWHFRMQNSRDVAFGASTAYVWDAARATLPGGRTVLAQSAYPVESMGNNGWERSTEYVKHTVEYFSQHVLAYPYPNAIAEAGIAGGMEYPGIVFDDYQARAKDLYSVTAHEIGHTWFPMIVGSNERRDAWMDEGSNTFADVYAEADFNHGEYAPKRDGEYAPKGGNPVDEILPTLNDPEAPPIMTAADEIAEKYRHPVTYFKTALGLVLLREQILGPERFDAAFSAYTRGWAYKHPSPSDFFRAMDSAAGEDLSWFWRGWFQENWTLDLAVQKVAYVDGQPAKGALVTVANLDRLVMPSTLEIRYTDGTSTRLTVPVETWQQHRTFTITVPGSQAVSSATIDPDHVLPDNDRANNTIRPQQTRGR